MLPRVWHLLTLLLGPPPIEGRSKCFPEPPPCTEHFPKSLAELGFESSPFSSCLYLVFNFAPCLPIKDEKGTLVATNFFRFHKKHFHPACRSAH